MYNLNEEKTFRKLIDGTVVEMRGTIVGRTREQNPRYDFKVGDHIVLNVDGTDIIAEENN